MYKLVIRGEITANTTEIPKKNCKRILQTVICQQTGQPRRNGCIFRNLQLRSSHHGSAEMNLVSIHEYVGSIPGLSQWVKDPALLWAIV